MIAGSEMEQSKVTVTSSTNAPVSGIFDGNNKAVVELPDCNSGDSIPNSIFPSAIS
jgi:hypothetical protein